MGPVKVQLIEELYAGALPLIHCSDKLVNMFVSTCLGGMDLGALGWLAGKVVHWAIRQIGGSDKKVALAIALRGEYCVRHGSSTAAVEKAWKLTNLCSVCHCIGHNKTNHPAALQGWLRQYNLVTEVLELCEHVKDDAETAVTWLDNLCSLF